MKKIWWGACLFLFICHLGLSAATTKEIDSYLECVDKARFQISELRWIAEEAERLGIQVYLFGGVASAFGLYVSKNCISGIDQLSLSDFVRSTQDIDLVVDGKAADISRFHQALLQKFPLKKGDDSRWEVRGLRVPYGGRSQMIGDADIEKQHSDSLSSGMIKLAIGEKKNLLGDLRAWGKKYSTYSHDLVDQKIHFYFNEEHSNAPRVLANQNPPIFSVIRFLTKIFQFGLELSIEDRLIIQKIIDEFNPKIDLRSDYARHWIEKNGIKLFLQSADIERSWNILEELGLRKKLMEVSDLKKLDSLAFWMNKEPLRSRPVSEGAGHKFSEIAEKNRWSRQEFEGRYGFIVSHETKNLVAFESIMKGAGVSPNVFISRSDSPGEVSILKSGGFYVRMGLKGAVDSGLTVRCEMDENAIEGKDFSLVPGTDYLAIHNRSVLKIIRPKSFLTLFELFSSVLNGTFGSEDRGILMMGMEKLDAEIHQWESKDWNRIEEIVNRGVQTHNELVLELWFSFPQSLAHASFLNGWFQEMKQLSVLANEYVYPRNSDSSKKLVFFGKVVIAALKQPHWRQHEQAWSWLKNLIRVISETHFTWGIERDLVSEILRLPEWRKNDDFYAEISSLLRRPSGRHMFPDLFSNYLFKDFGFATSSEGLALLEEIIKFNHGNADYQILSLLLQKKEWARHPEGLRLLYLVIETENGFNAQDAYIRKHSKRIHAYAKILDSPDWLDVIKNSSSVHAVILRHRLSFLDPCTDSVRMLGTGFSSSFLRDDFD